MEYGSDFAADIGMLEYSTDNIFDFLKDFDTLFFDSGRSAAKYLLRFIKYSCVALPEYLCESIVDCFPMAIKHYYSIDSNLQINGLDEIPWEKIDVFYLLHYFGTLQSERILKYISEKKQKYGFTIIEDTTHSIFTKINTIGDFCVCSLRKWFPIPDGGVLYSCQPIKKEEYDEIKPKQSGRIEGMVLKNLYLKGITREKETYRRILVDSEDQLDVQRDIYKISTISDFILKCQNIKWIIQKRRQNYKMMIDCIGDILPDVLSRRENDVPFIYVAKTDKRNVFRTYLTKNEIYCPVHWPISSEYGTEHAIHMSDRLISIPIDQRYSEVEINNAAKIIRGFFNE